MIEGGWKDSKVKIEKLDHEVQAIYFDEAGNYQKGNIEKGRKVVVVTYFEGNSGEWPMSIYIDYKTLEVLGLYREGRS
jgi:hypothetical protein